MTEAEVVNLLALIFMGEMIASVAALAYILRVFRGSRSVLFRLFVILDVIVVLVGVMLFGMAAVVVLDLPRLPYTGPALVVAIIILVGAPIVHAAVFWLLRRRRQPINEPGNVPEIGEPPV